MKKFAFLAAGLLGLALSGSVAQAACGPCGGPYIEGGFYLDVPEAIVIHRHHYVRVPPPPGYYAPRPVYYPAPVYYRPRLRAPYYPERYNYLPQRPAYNYYPGSYQPCW